jgi:hypothetical protein
MVDELEPINAFDEWHHHRGRGALRGLSRDQCGHAGSQPAGR